MQENFDQSLKEVLKHEGGFADHPKDPGGATNKGITIATFRKWMGKDSTVEQLKRITDDQVSHIYRKAYWNAVKGDELPSGIDYAVFDFGVNSGPTRAIKYLQTVLGVATDGKIGPATLNAARSHDPVRVIHELCDRRMAFLKALSTFATFGKGWTARVSGVRSKAISMASKQQTFDGGSNEGIIGKPEIVTVNVPTGTNTVRTPKKEGPKRLWVVLASLFVSVATGVAKQMGLF